MQNAIKLTLAQALGGTAEKIEVGISIGIQKSTEDLIELVRWLCSRRI